MIQVRAELETLMGATKMKTLVTKSLRNRSEMKLMVHMNLTVKPATFP